MKPSFSKPTAFSPTVQTPKKTNLNPYTTPSQLNTQELKTRLGNLRHNLDLLMDRGDLQNNDVNRLRVQNEKLSLENKLKIQEIEVLKQKHNQMVVRLQNRKTNVVRLYERIKEEFEEQVRPTLYHNMASYKRQVESLKEQLDKLTKERQIKQERYSEELTGIKRIYEEEMDDLKKTADDLISDELKQVSENQKLEEDELNRQIKTIMVNNEKQIKMNAELESELKEKENNETDEFVCLKRDMAKEFEGLFQQKKEEIKKTYMKRIAELEDIIRRTREECLELERNKEELNSNKNEKELENIKNSLNDKNEKSLELFKKKLEIEFDTLKQEENRLIKKIEELNCRIIEGHEKQAIDNQNKETQIENDFQQRFNQLVKRNEELKENLNMLDFENQKLEESHRNQINTYYQVKKNEFDDFKESRGLREEEGAVKNLILKNNSLVAGIANDEDKLEEELNNLKHTFNIKQEELERSEKELFERLKDQDKAFDDFEGKLSGRSDEESRLKREIIDQLKVLNVLQLDSLKSD